MYDKAGIITIMKPSTRAQIHHVNTTVNNVPKIKIVGFDNILGSDDLPLEYTNSTPCYHMCPGGKVHVFARNTVRILEPGSIMPVSEFNEVVEIMHIAGHLLAGIKCRNERGRQRVFTTEV